MKRPLSGVLRRAVGLLRSKGESVGATAASVFVLDSTGRSLIGLTGEWDWTRTSFQSEAASWPTVERALADGKPRLITADKARGAEAGWFEARGITSTMCVPLRSGARSFGVFFIDFERPHRMLEAAHDALLRDVTADCVRAFVLDAQIAAFAFT